MTVPLEIERRFLVRSETWRPLVQSSDLLEQIYLAAGRGSHLRVRRRGSHAFITAKGARIGATRVEIESPVSVDFFAAICAARLQVAGPLVKRRHRIPVGERLFEVDEYLGVHAGLVTAEVELPSEDAEFARPDWLGEEITGDPRYGNLTLARSASGPDERDVALP